MRINMGHGMRQNHAHGARRQPRDFEPSAGEWQESVVSSGRNQKVNIIPTLSCIRLTLWFQQHTVCV